MRLIFTILFLFYLQANATVYYVSNTGSDAANGTTTGTPWQTITKVNAASFNPGDQILFKKGGSWNERLSPPSSGSVGNVITFGAYGSGAAPIITGFQSVTGWTNVGNIWSATFSNSVKYQNTVYINSDLQAKGRFPNTGWLTISSHSGQTQITGTLTGTPNYTGGEIVVRNNHWTLDHNPITAQSTGTITIGNDPRTGLGIYYPIVDGNGYFIQNHSAVLDTLNEWCYDTTTKVIKVYATTTPTLKASSIDTLVYIKKKNYITFDGLQFEGANLYGFMVDSSTNVTIKNTEFQDMGGNGVWCRNTPYLTFTGNRLEGIFNNGLQSELETSGSNISATISNNVFFKIGHKHGMGFNRFATYEAFYFNGDKAQILNNHIDSIGYIGLHFFGDSVLIKNNYVSRFCFIKDDGGGIYTWMGGGDKPLGCIVRKNIVVNGITASDGNSTTTPATAGIYLDNESNYVLVDSNTVYNMPQSCLFFHLTNYCTALNNTLVTARFPFEMAYTGNNVFKYNTLYTGVNYLIAMTSGLSVSDSNYLFTQGDTSVMFGNFGNRTITYWRNTLGLDIHSTLLPTGITAAAPILNYNTTSAPVTVELGGTYINGKGATYINRVTVEPFQSALLFKSITDLPEPTIPGLLNRKIKIKFKR